MCGLGQDNDILFGSVSRLVGHSCTREAVVLNLFDVAAHFSPRLHEKFVSELMTRRNYCVISEHFAAHRLRSAVLGLIFANVLF